MIESFLPTTIAPLDIEVSRLRKSYGPEPVTVEGLVSMQPQSVADGPMGAPYRIHYLTLEAWRVGQGPLRAEPLTILRGIPRSADFAFEVPAATLLAMRVWLSESSRRAVLIEGLPDPPADVAFQAEIDRLVTPPAFDHPDLGRLTFDPSVRLLMGQAVWNGRRVEVSVEASSRDLRGPALSRAEAVWAQQSRIASEVTAFVIASTLAELEDETSPESISRLIALKYLKFRDDGIVEFWHDDGELFGGHSIVVRWRVGEPAYDYEIAG
jgi:hypothetical protein